VGSRRVAKYSEKSGFDAYQTLDESARTIMLEDGVEGGASSLSVVHSGSVVPFSLSSIRASMSYRVVLGPSSQACNRVPGLRAPSRDIFAAGKN
jgi:hypothetical protein